MSSLLPRLLVVALLLVAAPALAAKKALPPGERIDLNRATVAELMRLPGVGEKKAQAIVAHRQKQPFRRPEDVVQVKGLGPAWLRKVKGNVFAGTAAPAAPATSREEVTSGSIPSPPARRGRGGHGFSAAQRRRAGRPRRSRSPRRRRPR